MTRTDRSRAKDQGLNIVIKIFLEINFVHTYLGYDHIIIYNIYIYFFKIIFSRLGDDAVNAAAE